MSSPELAVAVVAGAVVVAEAVVAGTVPPLLPWNPGYLHPGSLGAGTHSSPALVASSNSNLQWFPLHVDGSGPGCCCSPLL